MAITNRSTAGFLKLMVTIDKKQDETDGYLTSEDFELKHRIGCPWRRLTLGFTHNGILWKKNYFDLTPQNLNPNPNQ